MRHERSLSRDEWFRLYDKVCKSLPDWDELPKIWRIQVHGKKLIVKSYGFCHWRKVIFLWHNGREFYHLERDMKIWSEKTDDKTPRKEYFKGNLVREYVGRQNCFVEFCQLLWKYHRLPSQKRFSQVENSLGLDKATAEQYIDFYQQCFCLPNRNKRTRATGNLSSQIL